MIGSQCPDLRWDASLVQDLLGHSPALIQAGSRSAHMKRPTQHLLGVPAHAHTHTTLVPKFQKVDSKTERLEKAVVCLVMLGDHIQSGNREACLRTVLPM